jgi:hypothetical protein
MREAAAKIGRIEFTMPMPDIFAISSTFLQSCAPNMNVTFDLGGVFGGVIGALGAYLGVKTTLVKTAEQERSSKVEQLNHLRKSMVYEVQQVGVELQSLHTVLTSNAFSVLQLQRVVFDVPPLVTVPLGINNLGQFSQAEANAIFAIERAIYKLRWSLDAARQDLQASLNPLQHLADINMEFGYGCAVVRQFLEAFIQFSDTESEIQTMIRKMLNLQVFSTNLSDTLAKGNVGQNPEKNSA